MEPTAAMPSAVAAASFKNSRRVVTSFIPGSDGTWGAPFPSPSVMAHRKALNLDQIRIAIEHFVSLHSDGMCGTALCTEPAADTDRFVFYHHGALALGELESFQMLQIELVDGILGLETLHRRVRKGELAQRHKPQTILGANIHTTAAENAFGAVLLVTLED